MHPTLSRIAILYPGIESVALGWLRFIKPEDCRDTGYLLIDYPGQGLSEGSMHPKESYLSSEGALQALAEHFGVNKLEAEFHLMGHSFGTGAALQFAGRHQVKRIVLIAPFTTLRNAVAERSFLLSVLLPTQMDNRAIIRQLLPREQPPQITIMHGGKDTSLPVAMGRELAALDPARITYLEFPADDHVSILTTCRDLIFIRIRKRGIQRTPPPRPMAETTAAMIIPAGRAVHGSKIIGRWNRSGNS